MDVRLGDRLTSVDNNRVVRPLDWGLEYARDWPCRNGWRQGQAADDPAKFLIDLNRRIVAASDNSIPIQSRHDFRLESVRCRFSPREKCRTRSSKRR